LHQERKLEALRSRPLPPRFAEVAIVTKMACVGADVRRRPAHYCPSACCPEPVAAITVPVGGFASCIRTATHGRILLGAGGPFVSELCTDRPF
jgi:hypothetical protein